MTIRTAIYTFLAGQSTITDIVSTRIYPVAAPQIEPGAALPDTIVFWRTGTQTDRHLTGPLTIKTETWRFACLSDAIDDADTLANALVTLLDGYRGAISDSPLTGTVTVLDCSVERVFDDPDEDLGIYSIAVDVRIQYR